MLEVQTVYSRRDVRAGVCGYAWWRTCTARFGRVGRALRVLLGLWLLWAGLRGLSCLPDMRQETALDMAVLLQTVALPAAALAISGVCLIAGWRGKWLTSWLAWSRFPKKGERFVYSFGSDCIRVILANGGYCLEYTGVTAVLEDRERFFLIVNAEVHILKKEDFTQGTEAAFREFITEKTGRPVARIGAQAIRN